MKKTRQKIIIAFNKIWYNTFQRFFVEKKYYRRFPADATSIKFANPLIISTIKPIVHRVIASDREIFS